jgi:acyl dehydratase
MRRIEVGDTLDLTKGPVTTVQLVMYAGASGDFNRIHYDLPFAQEAGLGGVIAHGMLTMGFAAEMLAAWAGPTAFVQRVGANFKSPVRPGDNVALRGTVTEVTPTAEGRLARISYAGHVADREVIAGEGAILFPA